MKKIYLLILFILCSQLSLSLEIVKVEGEREKVLMTEKNYRFQNKFYIKGIPGKQVKILSPKKLKSQKKNIGIEVREIKFRREEIILDNRGNGVFDSMINVKGNGSGNIDIGYEIQVKYIN